MLLPAHPPPDPEGAAGARLTKRLKKKDHRLTAPVKVDNMPDELKGCPHQTDFVRPEILLVVQS